MSAFDFGFQFTVEKVDKIATNVINITGNCYDGSHSFIVEGDYKIGDKVYVMGYLVMSDYMVVKHGLIH